MTTTSTADHLAAGFGTGLSFRDDGVGIVVVHASGPLPRYSTHDRHCPFQGQGDAAELELRYEGWLA
jgi:hypothetical protein